MPESRAEVGVIGGSGFYGLLEQAEQLEMETPYGPPSDQVTVGEVAGRRVAFIPRHGRTHTIPPHRINYRANLWALRELGVVRLMIPCACGSLRPEVRRGDFVICDQLVDRTWGRADTFYDGPPTTHISLADPYCPQLRPLAVSTARRLAIPVRDGGTVVVTQGPRFSTRAESRFYARQGWDVINMTQYPEVALARELEMCCVNVSLVTDYDAGIEEVEAVTVQEVVRVLAENNERLKSLLFELIPAIPSQRSCPCGSSLETARL
jgi:5'-methylthioadenosine phosphorylase